MKPKKHRIDDLVASDGELDIASQVAEIVTKASGGPYEWLLITAQHDFPCEGQIQATRDELLGDLEDALVSRYGLVATYYQGREVSPADFAMLRAEAMEGLGPLSRAVAEGRFP